MYTAGRWRPGRERGIGWGAEFVLSGAEQVLELLIRLSVVSGRNAALMPFEERARRRRRNGVRAARSVDHFGVPDRLCQVRGGLPAAEHAADHATHHAADRGDRTAAAAVMARAAPTRRTVVTGLVVCAGLRR